MSETQPPVRAICEHCEGRGIMDAHDIGDCDGGPCPKCDGSGVEPEKKAAPAEFFFLSLKHSRPGDSILTWWRPNQRGYVWNLDNAGRYTAEEAATLDGVSSIAIPCEVALAAACRYVEFDNLTKLGVTHAQWLKAVKQ